MNTEIDYDTLIDMCGDHVNCDIPHFNTIDTVSFKGKVFNLPESVDDVGYIILSQFGAEAFKRCDFSEATFTNTHLKETIFIKCQFDLTKFKDAKFTECRFIGCKFNGSEFYQNKFLNCEFVDCVFHNVIIDKSEICSIITDYTFNGCEFLRTIISNSTLNGIGFLSCNFMLTNFNSSQFNSNKETKYIYSSSFKSCIIDYIGMNATIGIHVDFIGCNINTLKLDYSTFLDTTFDTTSCDSFDAYSSTVSKSRFYNGRIFFKSDSTIFILCHFKHFNLDDNSYFHDGSRLDSCTFDDVVLSHVDLGVLMDCKFVEKITVIGGHIRNWLSRGYLSEYHYDIGKEPVKDKIEISEISENGFINTSSMISDDFSIIILSPKDYNDDAFGFHTKGDCGLKEEDRRFLNAYVNIKDDKVISSNGITYHSISDYLDKVKELANNILDDEGIENVEYTLGIIQKNVNLYIKYYQALNEENEEEFEQSLAVLVDDSNDETKNIDNAIKPKDE